ncbi:hypothetical protein GGI07_003671 [Coemansia sp. Benny D115]|nr:hypothetical protein GGI07_003671 [Coemansia sp. Benny D115]
MKITAVVSVAALATAVQARHFAHTVTKTVYIYANEWNQPTTTITPSYVGTPESTVEPATSIYDVTSSAEEEQNQEEESTVSSAEESPSSTVVADTTTTSTDPSPTGSTNPGNNNSDWVTKMVCRVNAVRAARGLQPLGISSQLNAVAQGQSDYQNRVNQMTHNNSEGSLGTRLTKAGIAWSGAAENVAAGMQTSEQAQQLLENSPGHLANMVSPNMAYFGAARTNNYFTQEFYALPGNARPDNVPNCN